MASFFHHSSVATSLASSSRSGKHWWIFIAFSFINNNHFSREKKSIIDRCACLTRVICCARRNNTEKFHQFFSSLQIHIFRFSLLPIKRIFCSPRMEMPHFSCSLTHSVRHQIMFFMLKSSSIHAMLILFLYRRRRLSAVPCIHNNSETRRKKL